MLQFSTIVYVLFVMSESSVCFDDLFLKSIGSYIKELKEEISLCKSELDKSKIEKKITYLKKLQTNVIAYKADEDKFFNDFNITLSVTRRTEPCDEVSFISFKSFFSCLNSCLTEEKLEAVYRVALDKAIECNEYYDPINISELILEELEKTNCFIDKPSGNKFTLVSYDGPYDEFYEPFFDKPFGCMNLCLLQDIDNLPYRAFCNEVMALRHIKNSLVKLNYSDVLFLGLALSACCLVLIKHVEYDFDQEAYCSFLDVFVDVKQNFYGFFNDVYTSASEYFSSVRTRTEVFPSVNLLAESEGMCPATTSLFTHSVKVDNSKALMLYPSVDFLIHSAKAEMCPALALPDFFHVLSEWSPSF